MANEEEYFEIDTIMIPLEDGTEMECAIMDEFEMDGVCYVVLSPIEEGDMISDEQYLYRYAEDGEDMILSYIEDDAELERASEYYASLYDESEDEE